MKMVTCEVVEKPCELKSGTIERETTVQALTHHVAPEPTKILFQWHQVGHHYSLWYRDILIFQDIFAYHLKSLADRKTILLINMDTRFANLLSSLEGCG